MTNVKTELIKAILAHHSYSDIVAFNVRLCDGLRDKTSFQVVGETFNENVIPEELEYDSGEGPIYLFGCVLFSDGSWLSRGEYDGIEWWEYNVSPTVNQVLEGAY